LPYLSYALYELGSSTTIPDNFLQETFLEFTKQSHRQHAAAYSQATLNSLRLLGSNKMINITKDNYPQCTYYNMLEVFTEGIASCLDKKNHKDSALGVRLFALSVLHQISFITEYKYNLSTAMQKALYQIVLLSLSVILSIACDSVAHKNIKSLSYNNLKKTLHRITKFSTRTKIGENLTKIYSALSSQFIDQRYQI
jgi:hypothetical protein